MLQQQQRQAGQQGSVALALQEIEKILHLVL